MPQQPLLYCEIFDVWDIDFTGLFLNSFSFMYILMVVDFISKWVETKATQTDYSKVLAYFIKTSA